MTNEWEGPDAAALSQMVCDEGLFTWCAAVGIQLAGEIHPVGAQNYGCMVRVSAGVGAARTDVPFKKELARQLRALADKLDEMPENGALVGRIPLMGGPGGSA